ncbi:MAG: hypothetical protein Ct9H90mP13_00400 [Pseudomonadota bacterium]|nr:MAG: hypothetical protein Ct9H90mP13_00400 [Pseudomonadota bacterium]
MGRELRDEAYVEKLPFDCFSQLDENVRTICCNSGDPAGIGPDISLKIAPGMTAINLLY